MGFCGALSGFFCRCPQFRLTVAGYPFTPARVKILLPKTFQFPQRLFDRFG
jgi:hypothetical protein